jgi:hypothetical protein
LVFVADMGGVSIAPITRKAGQHARERARKLTIQSGLFVIGSTFLIAVLVLHFGLRSNALLAVEVIWICGLFVVHRRDAIIDRWSRGADGEEYVGHVIEAMHSDGWRVLHDVSFGGANIDHVMLGPSGVFTVETKSHRGRIAVERIDPHMLKQAYAEKKKLEAITGLKVEPLLVFSRAYLVGRVPSRHQGVMVLPARMLAGHLKRRASTYSCEQVEALYSSMARAIAAADA